SGAVPEEVLKGRLVLVGVTASAAFDHHSSPFSPSQLAIEVQANAINDILMQRILRPVPLALQWGVLLLAASLCGAFMAGSNALRSILAAGVLSLLFWGVAMVALNYNWYFPIAAPLL